MRGLVFKGRWDKRYKVGSDGLTGFMKKRLMIGKAEAGWIIREAWPREGWRYAYHSFSAIIETRGYDSVYRTEAEAKTELERALK